MHNNIMAAGSKERPPMLGPGRYSQWHSRFLRYLDTKSNGEYLRKCIFDGPYMPTNVLIAAVEAAENILPVAAHEEVETIHNMTAENKLYFQKNKTEDTTPRYNNDSQSRQFGNQRTVTVAGARETVGSPVVQKTGIQCFNCKGFGHYARECRKPKGLKTTRDTDEEIDEQEFGKHTILPGYMEKIQEVHMPESSSMLRIGKGDQNAMNVFDERAELVI
ncbi:integrase, catalytic region, zinc finger, CCHC-type containing protein [Tanacetum coccineum]